MKILFRADTVGKFHKAQIQRTIALAQELKKQNCEIFFCVHQHQKSLIQSIELNNFNPLVLSDSKYSYEFLESHEAQDASDVIKACKGIQFHCAIIDHYQLGYIWEKEIRKIAKYIFTIDDLADRKHDCDFLLDQNEFGNKRQRYDSLIPSNAELFVGSKYAIISKSILEIKEKNTHCRKTLKKILVYYGENDLTNETQKAIDAIKCFPTLHATIAIGSYNQRKFEGNENIQIIPSHQIYNKNIYEHDLFLTLGGIDVWEKIALGIPLLVTQIHDIHQEIIDECEKRAYLRIAANEETVTTTLLKDWISYFLSMPELLNVFSMNSLRAIRADSTTFIADTIIRGAKHYE